MSRAKQIVPAALVAIVAIAAGILLSWAVLERSSAPTLAQATLIDPPRALPPMAFIDEQGQPFGPERLRGRWSILFFGFTYCPDICPTTLALLRELKGKLPAEALERLRVVMISVDPQRDSPQQLKQYLGYFDAGFQGLTGELADIQKLASAVSIPFIPADTSKPNYTVDHSGNLVILGPDGTQRGFIRAPLNNQKLATQLPVLVGSEG